jgi:tetratricopeptide (TPR) repeat protein
MLQRVIAVAISASIIGPPQYESAVRQFIQKQFEAVALYRQGNTAGALELLASMAIGDQVAGVRLILRQQAAIAAGFSPNRNDIPWTPRLLRALAVLHMEAARTVPDRISGKTEGARDDVLTHIALARNLFTFVFTLVKEDEHSAARWQLAIGLEHLSREEFAKASFLLIPACKEEGDHYPPLLVACGTLQESLSVLPNARYLGGADLVSLERGDPTLSRSVRELQDARDVRKYLLSTARRYFERAAELDPQDTEAPLRLGNVYFRLGDDGKAEKVLRSLLARPALKEADGYLANLFLGRVLDHRNRLDEAAAAYDRSIALGAGQSALVARAHNARRRGNAADTATFAEQATASKTVRDPWWTYALGQYWVPAALFEQLRAEALQ